MNEPNLATKNTVLIVSFEERNEAKKAAGKLENGENALGFDEEAKHWFAKPGADLSKLSKWLPDQHKGNPVQDNNPAAEFGATLAEAGFELDGLPVMDGKKHRVRTADDKKGEKTGVYAGYLDGVPAGWYQDHRIHDQPVKWVSTGQQVDAEAQAHLRAIAAQNRIDRENALQRQYAHNARRSGQVYNAMPVADGSQEYLVNKGVKAFPGVKADKKNRVVIPLVNEEGEVRTLQRISANGFKSLKKNGQKTGNFFVVGGELKNGEPVLYAEGYSTAASISEATNRPVVMTVDAGNLPKVADKLKDKYPDSLHVVLGDDDRKNAVNKGMAKAEEAATIANGVFTVPAFTAEEKERGLTDFNDLHQSRGLDAVRDQVEGIITEHTHKAETMADKEHEAINTGPVITENFEREMDAALNVNHSSIDLEPYQSEEDEYAEYMDQYYGEQNAAPAPVAAAEQNDDVENSIEPHIEQEKAQTADDDVRAWLSSSRVSTADMLAEDDEREGRKREEFKQVEPDAEEPVFKRQSQDQDYFEDSSYKPVVPDRVAKSYIEVEGKYYFQNRPDSLAFVDKGAKLQTKLSNSQVAGSMIDIAEARGWTEIQVKGTEDFRREAWLQATARGLTAHGYKPKEEDLARLKKVAGERNINEVEAREVADNVKTSPSAPSGTTSKNQSEAPTSKTGTTESSSTAQGKNEGAKVEAEEKVNKLAGKLVEHGAAPYEHKKDNKDNYYVTLENADGKQSTTWGVDLQRAMAESEAQPGDHVELENLGRKAVTVEKDVKDETGKVVKKETINTFRNSWQVKADAIRDQERPAREIVKEHPDLVNEITAVKLAEKVSQSMNADDKERFMSRVRDKLADKVASGEKGPELKIKEVQTVDNPRVKDTELER
ncbi:LPD7 domain-containing protein [Serratia entomophila]|uniref:LPD7 domain-containing protein n=1 Tax=Serratia entomophila TaxID=42906 RepID=UPI001F4BE383|nr:LPD7 domain-containing protein [Serratia entomophila]ULG10496.1 DNA primase traC [Serratia entomophila]CAI2017509.1 DNA primase TraC [Serratia entomophila]